MHYSAIKFARHYKMDQCLGCLDGTYVPIRKPTRNSNAYICRKAFHALNVLVSNYYRVSDFVYKLPTIVAASLMNISYNPELKQNNYSL